MAWRAARRMVPVIREVFPAPDTPVSTVSLPLGMATFTPFRLCRQQPSTRSHADSSFGTESCAFSRGRDAWAYGAGPRP